jgi:hypothetical protein
VCLQLWEGNHKTGQSFINFQYFAIGIALASLPFVHYSFTVLSQLPAKSIEKTKSFTPPKAAKLGFLQFLKQLTQQPNFCVFSVEKLLQSLLCTFEKNHFSLFLGQLLTVHSAADSRVLGLIISLSFVVPHLLVIAFTPVVQLHGVYKTIRALWASKLALSVLAVTYLQTATDNMEVQSVSMYVFILFAGRVLAECVCRLFPLVLSQLVDQDSQSRQESVTLSASLIGSTAIIAKPGESIAPLIGFYMFSSRWTGSNGSIEMSHVEEVSFAHTFTLMLLVPCIIVTMQLVLWRWFMPPSISLKEPGRIV